MGVPRCGLGGTPLNRRISTAALLIAVVVGGLIPARAAADSALPFPDSMAAVGDSITQAASSAGSLGVDAPQNSWSTGTSSAVNSHYLRLVAAGAPIAGQNHNRSVSGSRMGGLTAQMQTVVPLQPDYLTVLMGGNDLCTDTVAQMTSVTDFRNQFSAAMSTLTAGSPTTNVYVVSIPNVYQLWNLFKGNVWARFIWGVAGICQSLLANPTSTQAADVQRRETVRQRNIDFNAALASVCAQFARCRFDGNAAFNTAFAASDLSGDYFHPSVAGQAKLAAVSWAAGYTWGAPPPPPVNQPPVADFTFGCVNLACTFTDASTDDVGIATRSWNFGDGTPPSAQPAHTYGAAGTYDVTLTVTDGGGLQDDAVTPVTVTAPQAPTMRLESLTGQSTVSGRNTWSAMVTIVVADTTGRGVANATVIGSWSAGTGSGSCTTALDGRCSVTVNGLNLKKSTPVTYSVSNVTHASFQYAQGPLTSVTVARPA